MSAEPSTLLAYKLKDYRFPKTIISRFITRRTLKSASIWAFIFGIYVADKTLAFAKLAPTHADKVKITGSFTNNVGLNALLGTPHPTKLDYC